MGFIQQIEILAMVKEINSDYFLWKRIKAGETKAFHELYSLHADVLFSFGTIFTKDHELVRDCIHDLFFDLYKYRKNLADNDNIRNYLFKSLKRKIQASGNSKLNIVYSEDFRNETDRQTNYSENEENEELETNLDRITKAMHQLPERQQEILNLRFQLDLPYTEIAEILNISIESVRTSVYRSIKLIREELGNLQIEKFEK